MHIFDSQRRLGTRTGGKRMKPIISSILGVALLFAVTACDNRPKSVGEKVEDRVKDGLDARPNEKAKDLGEDLRDTAKDAGRDVRDAVKDASR